MNVLQIQPSKLVNRVNVTATPTAASALAYASTANITPLDFTVKDAVTKLMETQLLLTVKVHCLLF